MDEEVSNIISKIDNLLDRFDTEKKKEIDNREKEIEGHKRERQDAINQIRPIFERYEVMLKGKEKYSVAVEKHVKSGWYEFNLKISQDELDTHNLVITLKLESNGELKLESNSYRHSAKRGAWSKKDEKTTVCSTNKEEFVKEQILSFLQESKIKMERSLPPPE